MSDVLAGTVAAELAQRAWGGIDAPAAVDLRGIDLALHRGLPGEFTVGDVARWAQPHIHAVADAGDPDTLTCRMLGVVAASMILGARLQETHGT